MLTAITATTPRLSGRAIYQVNSINTPLNRVRGSLVGHVIVLSSQPIHINATPELEMGWQYDKILFRSCGVAGRRRVGECGHTKQARATDTNYTSI